MSEKQAKGAAQAAQTQPAAEQAAPARPRLRIHFLVEMPGGPNISTPVKGTLPLGGRNGKKTYWAFACNSSAKQDDLNRGTGEPWCVRCLDCEKTEAFRLANRPKPGAAIDHEQMLATGEKDCGCG